MSDTSEGTREGEGQEWPAVARGHREPTSWTLLLRRAATAYLVLATIQWVVTTALFTNVQSLERATKAQNPSLPADQVQASASFGVTAGWAAVAVLGVVMLVLAFGSYRGWRWAFWAVLAWLALSAIGVLTNLLALSSPATQSQPPASIVVQFVFSLVALALAIWLILAAVRYGPWGMRKAQG